jgi:hypothetical protein
MWNRSRLLRLDSQLLARRAGDALASSLRRLEESERRISATLTILLGAASCAPHSGRFSFDDGSDDARTAGPNRPGAAVAPPLVSQ